MNLMAAGIVLLGRGNHCILLHTWRQGINVHVVGIMSGQLPIPPDLVLHRRLSVRRMKQGRSAKYHR
jgi:hypothetical protein